MRMIRRSCVGAAMPSALRQPSTAIVGHFLPGRNNPITPESPRTSGCISRASRPSPQAATPSDASPSTRDSDVQFAHVESARLSQRRSTDLLARLLESSDPTGTARQHVEALNEEFFMTGGTYLTLASKDGNPDVAARLERALTAAWQVKQSTLRPELQLLNNLMRAENASKRKQIYLEGDSDLVATLAMNDRWFAAALGRMAEDVNRQPPNPMKAQLLSKLKAIQQETEALERQTSRQPKQQ